MVACACACVPMPGIFVCRGLRTSAGKCRRELSVQLNVNELTSARDIVEERLVK